MPDHHVELNYSFYCDDVREEINGKMMYIGVYGDDIIIHQTPVSLSLFVVINVLTAKAGKVGMEFQNFVEGKLTSSSKGHLEVGEESEGKHAVINLPLPVFDISEDSVLTTKFREDGGEWHTAATANIFINSVEAEQEAKSE